MLLFWKKWHSWKYRNPASRTCTNCGRVENFYQQGTSVHRFPVGNWEEMYPLATNTTAHCYIKQE